MTSVRSTIPFIPRRSCSIVVLFALLGLISQVAEDLWEVKDKTIKNLSKQDISIVDYKRKLVKHSQRTLYLSSSSPLTSWLLQVKLRSKKPNYPARARRKERRKACHSYYPSTSTSMFSFPPASPAAII